MPPLILKCRLVYRKHILIFLKKFKFNGLIITDDLNMGALYLVSKDKAEIAKKAVLAGNDLLLYEFLTFDEIELINNALKNDRQISKQIEKNINHSILKFRQF